MPSSPVSEVSPLFRMLRTPGITASDSKPASEESGTSTTPNLPPSDPSYEMADTDVSLTLSAVTRPPPMADSCSSPDTDVSSGLYEMSGFCTHLDELV